MGPVPGSLWLRLFLSIWDQLPRGPCRESKGNPAHLVGHSDGLLRSSPRKETVPLLHSGVLLLGCTGEESLVMGLWSRTGRGKEQRGTRNKEGHVLCSYPHFLRRRKLRFDIRDFLKIM